ncbi:MAG: hypothetical protein AB7W28_06100 [Armatimonadota bacterium]
MSQDASGNPPCATEALTRAVNTLATEIRALRDEMRALLEQVVAAREGLPGATETGRGEGRTAGLIADTQDGVSAASDRESDEGEAAGMATERALGALVPSEAEAAAAEYAAPVEPDYAAGQRAAAWLESQGVVVMSHRGETLDDRALLPLALELGNNFDDLQRLHDAIRRSQAERRKFRLNLAGRPPEEISRCVAFAYRLRELGMLPCNYSKSVRVLEGIPQVDDGRVYNFFTGRWFELYVMAKTDELLKASGVSYDKLVDVVLTLQDGTTGELDLFYLIDGVPLLLECKTGDYDRYLQRVRAIAQQLSMPAGRTFLVLLTTRPELQQQVNQLWGIVMADRHSLEGLLRAALDGSGVLADQSAMERVLIGAVAPGAVHAFLAKRQMRPLPAERRKVLGMVPKIVADADGPITGRELMERVAEATVSVSKSRAREIILALVRGGGLLDENGQELTVVSVPFAKLAGNSAEELEAHCVEAYAGAFLSADDDWFDQEAHRAEFAKVVGAPVPSDERLDRIRARLRRVGVTEAG